MDSFQSTGTLGGVQDVLWDLTQMQKVSEFWKRSKGWALLPVLDRAQLADSSAGDLDFAQQLLDAFLRQLPTTIESMRQAVLEEKLGDLRYHTRSARDSSQAVGAQRLFAICQSMEREVQIDLAEPWLSALGEEFLQFRALVGGANRLVNCAA